MTSGTYGMLRIVERAGTPARTLTACAVAFAVVLAALAVGTDLARAGDADVAADRRVPIDFFFNAGCPDCERVRAEILPQLADRYAAWHTLRERDLARPDSVALLIAYQESLGIAGNEPVSVIVDETRAFVGFEAIHRGVFAALDEAIAARLEPDWRPRPPVTTPDSAATLETAAGRVRDFALPAVVSGGLLDGINPCAISTLVFFMSLLAVARVPARGILAVGGAFCLAVFVTYTAIGFGLLGVLRSFQGFPLVRSIVEKAMAAGLLVLSFLSFRDAFRYRRTGRAEAVALQLPERLKARIHRIMRNRLKTRNLVAAGVAIGSAVTVLESVCTGQVYIPTLVVVINSNASAAAAWGYLLLYNALFVLPLVVVFGLTYTGLRVQTLLAWTRRNTVLAKVLLGVFFGAMALLMAVL